MSEENTSSSNVVSVAFRRQRSFAHPFLEEAAKWHDTNSPNGVFYDRYAQIIRNSPGRYAGPDFDCIAYVIFASTDRVLEENKQIVRFNQLAALRTVSALIETSNTILGGSLSKRDDFLTPFQIMHFALGLSNHSLSLYNLALAIKILDDIAHCYPERMSHPDVADALQASPLGLGERVMREAAVQSMGLKR